MTLPEDFVVATQQLLKADYPKFEQALQGSAPTSIRLNNKLQFNISEEAVKWCPFGYYLDKRPSFTFDPLFHGGAYYVQEASSMFLYQAVKQFIEPSSVVLDLCASPGGKSTLLLQTIDDDSLLVANEIIRSRAYILDENTTKWGNTNVVVTNNKPANFGKLGGFFDAMVIDAPCSGEGMFRKDAGAIDEWSLHNVDVCAERQRSILTDVWEALKEDGILIYSTCTYNAKENEENVQWICDELGAEVLHLDISDFPEITETPQGYHFYPHKTKGEGFFLALMNKTSESFSRKKAKSGKPISKCKLTDFTTLKLKSDNNTFVFNNDSLKAYNSDKMEQIIFLENNLNCLRAGLLIGEKKGKDFIPSHQVAVSKDLELDSVDKIEVDYKTAIAFLRKEAISLPEAEIGYNLIFFKGLPLGWVKNIGNRSNNLYPNEWRIRSSHVSEVYQPVIL